MFHPGDKEILLGVEWDSLHDDAEVNLTVVLEIHLVDLEQGISFVVEKEVSDGEKLIALSEIKFQEQIPNKIYQFHICNYPKEYLLSAALVHPFQHLHQHYQFLGHLSLKQ